MYLKQIVDEIGDLANDTSLKSTGDTAARTKAWVRESYYLDIIAQRTDWWFLEKNATIQTTAEITAGTVTVTEDSAAVTGSGTSFASTDVNKMLVVNGHAQRITSVTDSTNLTLESAWEKTTASGSSYSIVQDRYDLPRWLDVKKILEIKQKGRKPLEGLSKHQAENKWSNRSAIGDPNYFVPVGLSRSTYTTGTVSGTLGAKVLTGDSTAWTSSDIEQLDLIKVGSYVYTVDSVDSATQITVFEDLVEAVATSTTYEAVLDRHQIELYPFPRYSRALRVFGAQNAPPLNDDSDIPLLPDEWQHLLVKGGYLRALKHNQDPGVQLEMAEYQSLLRDLKSSNARDNYRTDTWWNP